MEALSTAIATGWVLLWIAGIWFYAPLVALGRSGRRRALGFELGPVLVWTWLTISAGTPLAAAMHGLNWFTALVLSAAWPLALWLIRHREAYRARLRNMARSSVFAVLTLQTRGSARPVFRGGAALLLAMPLLPFSQILTGGIDIRPPAPADFDVVWHARQLLNGILTWDPLASFVAVLLGVSATDALHVVAAVRLALVAFGAGAAAMLALEVSGKRWLAALAAAAVVVMTPTAPLVAQAWVLTTLAGAISVVLWFRERDPRDGWHVAAAFALVIGQTVPFATRPQVLWQLNASAQYLEHGAAARQALRIARSQPDGDWMLVGPPEQQLEIDGYGRGFDLVRFVTLFEGRTANATFRFGLPVRRLFVFVEKQPFDAGDRASDVQFPAMKIPAYRVPRERLRLQRAASLICDDYRRTHAGAAVIYDDAVLRVYRIDL